MQGRLRVSLRQLSACHCSRQRSMSNLKPNNGYKRNEVFSRCSFSSFVLGRKIYNSETYDCPWTSKLRSYSAESRVYGDIRDRGKNETTSTKYASVDPKAEEEFIFFDYSEPEEISNVSSPCQHQAPVDTTTTAVEKKIQKKSDIDVYHRTLELELQSLKDVMTKESDPDACIEFHDAGFPQIQNKSKPHRQQKVYGTPDSEVPVSDTCCNGCGAVMHCTVPDLAGYLPSEKFKRLTEEKKLNKAICQRCYLLVHHQKALNIKMSKEEYRNIVSRIQQEKALVLLLVDLLDIPDSIIPDLLDLVGKNKHIVVLGNKIDLLPGDSDNYLNRIKRQLSQYCTDAGISNDNNIKDVHLISAKTGYGIENLISSLQSSWKYKGDVYLVGTANAGKSTLFNTLLDSDYCKSKASDVIHKATISPWPGTTLNLLKFPIINPTPYRMFRRSERLKSESSWAEHDLNMQELRRLQQFSKQGYLVGRVGRTFRMETQTDREKGIVDFDPEDLSVGDDVEESEDRRSRPSRPVEFTHNELKDAHWLYDTPGIIKEQDILSLLTEQELKIVVPNHAIIPRTFVLKPGMALFLGALGRIDYLEGETSCWFSVITSNQVPVHITSLEKANDIYHKHAGNTLLGVPIGGEERMKNFPPLLPQDFELRGLGPQQATADIKLSSAGWVAVTGQEEDRLLLRVHAPEGAGLSLRTPPLLPHIASLKGERIRKSPAYKTRKPPVVMDGSWSAQAAQHFKLRKRK